MDLSSIDFSSHRVRGYGTVGLERGIVDAMTQFVTLCAEHGIVAVAWDRTNYHSEVDAVLQLFEGAQSFLGVPMNTPSQQRPWDVQQEEIFRLRIGTPDQRESLDPLVSAYFHRDGTVRVRQLVPTLDHTFIEQDRRLGVKRACLLAAEQFKAVAPRPSAFHDAVKRSTRHLSVA